MITRITIFIMFLLSLAGQYLGQEIFPYSYFPNAHVDSIIVVLKNESPESKEDAILNKRLLANAYMRNGRYLTSQNILLKVLADLNESDDEILKGILYLELAAPFKFDAKYDIALTNYLKGITIFKENQNWELLCQSYLSVGEYYRRIGNMPLAMDYIEKAIDLYESKNIKSDEIFMRALGRKAAVLNESNKMLESITYSEQLITFSTKFNRKDFQAMAHNEMGASYLNLVEFDSSNYHFEQAEILYREVGELHEAVNAFRNRISSYGREGKSSEICIDMLRLLISEVNEYNLDYPLHYIYKSMYLHYEKLGVLDSALVYQDKYFISIIEVQRNRLNTKITEVKESYENEKIKNEKSVIEQELVASEVIINQQKRERFIVFLLLGFSLLIVVILLWFYRSKKKINNVLEEKNKQKELLLKEVNHRVKNNMQMVSSLLELQMFHVSDEQTKKSLQEGVARINALGFAHQELYQNDDITYILLGEYLKLIVNSLTRKLDLEVILKIPKDFRMHIEKAQAMGFIVNELITNSIKYAWQKEQTNKEIKISIDNTSQTILFIYSDNGSGFPENYQERKSTSLGTSLIKSFVERQLSGTLKTRNSQGATMEITFNIDYLST